MSWKTELIRPIVPAKGKPIVTLADARAFILALPDERHLDEDVQTACEALLMAAEGRGPVLHATVGIGRLVKGHVGAPAPSKKTHWRNSRSQSSWR